MTLTIDTLNLDGMNADELMDFWMKTNSVRPIAFAKQLFPTRPKGYVRITRELGCYASNKATAMECRTRGQIRSALMYEDICERIHSRLPLFARW